MVVNKGDESDGRLRKKNTPTKQIQDISISFRIHCWLAVLTPQPIADWLVGLSTS